MSIDVVSSGSYIPTFPVSSSTLRIPAVSKGAVEVVSEWADSQIARGGGDAMHN